MSVDNQYVDADRTSFKARLQKVRTMEIGFFMSDEPHPAWSSTIVIMVEVTNQGKDFRIGTLHYTE